MKKWLLVIIAALIILLSYSTQSVSLLNPENGVWQTAKNINYTSETLSVPGLYSPVTVSMDKSGVAHILAKNDHDLFLAQGYYVASNRLFQMEFQALLASGNLSKYVGSAAQGSDYTMRLVGLPYNAETTSLFLQTQFPSYYGLLEDFSQGVNDYINSSNYVPPLLFKLLGIEPFYWNPFDTLVWSEYMSWSLITGASDPLLSDQFFNSFGFNNTSLIWPYYPYYTENVTVMPGDGTVNGLNLHDLGISPNYVFGLNWYSSELTGVSPQLLGNLSALISQALNNISDPYGYSSHDIGSPLGSNSWVVTGSRSATGYPMLANDPHLPLLAPSVWVPLQLESNDMNVTGWALSGIPGVLIGHTPSTSWGITTSEGNSANDYLEILNGTNYLYEGKWLPMETRNFTLGGKAMTIYVTNNGPLIAKDGNYGIALNWYAQNPQTSTVTETMLDKSTNYSQMVDALKYWNVPPQNFALVSTNETGIITAGSFPLIPEDLPNGKSLNVVGSRSLLNGSSGLFEPNGTVPFQYLPQSTNPERGFLMAPNQPTAWEDYPYPFIGGFWASGGRAQTIYHYLMGNDKVSIADMMELQSNVSDYWALQLKPYLVNAIGQMTLNSTQREAFLILENWNSTAYTNSTGITVYWYTLSELYNDSFDRILKMHGLGSSPQVFESTLLYLASNYQNSSWLNSNFTVLAQQSFREAVTLLLGKLGQPSGWNWGKVHMLEIASMTGLSEFSIGPLPMFGDDHTVSVGGVPLSVQIPEPYVTVSSSLREISSPATNQFYGVFPGGPSENVLSYYFSNQLTYWMEHRYYDMSDQKVTAVIRYV